MRKIFTVSITLLLALSLTGSLAVAENENINDSLRTAVQESFQMANSEDLEGYMDLMHPSSPSYRRTRRVTRQLMDRYDLNYELLSFEYVGTNGKYKLARVKQKTTNTSDAAFRDNITVNLWAFRKDDKEWKSWNTMLLEREFLSNG
mgnify:CR=1 FL=1